MRTILIGALFATLALSSSALTLRGRKLSGSGDPGDDDGIDFGSVTLNDATQPVFGTTFSVTSSKSNDYNTLRSNSGSITVDLDSDTKEEGEELTCSADSANALVNLDICEGANDAADCRDAMCIGTNHMMTISTGSLPVEEVCASLNKGGNAESLNLLQCAYVDVSITTKYENDFAGSNGAQLDAHGRASDYSDWVDAFNSSTCDYEGLDSNSRDALLLLHNSIQEHVLVPMFKHALEQCDVLATNRDQEQGVWVNKVDDLSAAQAAYGKMIRQYKDYAEAVSAAYDLRKDAIQAYQNDGDTKLAAAQASLIASVGNQNAALASFRSQAQSHAAILRNHIINGAEDLKKRKNDVEIINAKVSAKNTQIYDANAALAALDDQMRDALTSILSTLDSAAAEIDKVEDNRDDVLSNNAGTRDTSGDALFSPYESFSVSQSNGTITGRVYSTAECDSTVNTGGDSEDRIDGVMCADEHHIDSNGTPKTQDGDSDYQLHSGVYDGSGGAFLEDGGSSQGVCSLCM